MRCCASPITSTAGDFAPPAADVRGVATEFEALLLAQALRPLAKPMGFYGDLVVAEAAHSVAAAQSGGLAVELERIARERA